MCLERVVRLVRCCRWPAGVDHGHAARGLSSPLRDAQAGQPRAPHARRHGRHGGGRGPPSPHRHCWRRAAHAHQHPDRHGVAHSLVVEHDGRRGDRRGAAGRAAVGGAAAWAADPAARHGAPACFCWCLKSEEAVFSANWRQRSVRPLRVRRCAAGSWSLPRRRCCCAPPRRASRPSSRRTTSWPPLCSPTCHRCGRHHSARCSARTKALTHLPSLRT